MKIDAHMHFFPDDSPEDSAWTIKAFYEQMFTKLNLSDKQQNAIWSRTIVTILQL